MKLGEYNELIIGRSSKIGLFLQDEEENEVLLPSRYVPAQYELGDTLRVFVYNDSEDRMIATTDEPYCTVNSFAYLEAVDQNRSGTFLNMGLMKDLFVPKKNQLAPMKPGEHYLVWVYIDQITDRLVASSNLERMLSDRPLDLEPGDEVEIIVWNKHEVGYRVVVNEEYVGMVYRNQLFQQLEEGQRLTAYVNRIREDGKLDILLQKPGVANIEPSAQALLDHLKACDGFLPLTDKSPPELIATELSMSKKAFKKALGALYKARLVQLEEKGVRLKD